MASVLPIYYFKLFLPIFNPIPKAFEHFCRDYYLSQLSMWETGSCRRVTFISREQAALATSPPSLTYLQDRVRNCSLQKVAGVWGLSVTTPSDLDSRVTPRERKEGLISSHSGLDDTTPLPCCLVECEPTRPSQYLALCTTTKSLPVTRSRAADDFATATSSSLGLQQNIWLWEATPKVREKESKIKN